MTSLVTMIPSVDARDFPPAVDDYCVDKEISTHYQNDVVYIEDDGNVFAEWLKSIGFDFNGEDSVWIAIYAT